MCTISTTGSGGASDSKPAIVTSGKATGRKSQCEALAQSISAKVEAELKEGHVLPGHVHTLISIPPKLAVSSVVRTGGRGQAAGATGATQITLPLTIQ